uniref:Uncharacterized protein n=1 Tax=Tetranychus urticae TaxID=32264 RepID=T1KQC0_TETUR
MATNNCCIVLNSKIKVSVGQKIAQQEWID